MTYKILYADGYVLRTVLDTLAQRVQTHLSEGYEIAGSHSLLAHTVCAAEVNPHRDSILWVASISVVRKEEVRQP